MEYETVQSEGKRGNPRYLTDEEGTRVVGTMVVEEYDALLEELEDLEDIRDAEEDKATMARGEEDVLPWEQARKVLEAERAELRRRGEL